MSVFIANTPTPSRRLLTAAALCLTLLSAPLATPAADAATGAASTASSNTTTSSKRTTAKSARANGRPKPVGKGRLKRAQRLLDIYASGRHDSTTRSVTKRFQKLRDLPAYGIIDLDTYIEIKAAFLLLQDGPIKADSASASSTGGVSITATPTSFVVPDGQAEITDTEREILEKIGKCESDSNPASSSNKTYRGKYQFDRQTWSTVGGEGDPATATEIEQDERAAILLRRRGVAPWPVCGRGLL